MFCFPIFLILLSYILVIYISLGPNVNRFEGSECEPSKTYQRTQHLTFNFALLRSFTGSLFSNYTPGNKFQIKENETVPVAPINIPL